MGCYEEEVEEDKCAEHDSRRQNLPRRRHGCERGEGVPWDEDWREGDVEFPVFAAEVFVGV